MSLSPRNKANWKLSSLSPTSSSLHHSQSPRAKAPVACDHPRGGGGGGDDINDVEEAEGSLKLPYLRSATTDRRIIPSNMSDSEPQECSMCGDVGFPTELFQCNKCLHRFQHTYCSRYYPSILDLDVCDWCSQETNPSAGSSTATTTMTGTLKPQKITTKPGSASGVTNLGKRKVVAAEVFSPSSSSRKNCSLDPPPSTKSTLKANITTWRSGGERNSKTNRKGEVSDKGSEHKDALELLLEVAQKVAEGQMINNTGIGTSVRLNQTSSTLSPWDSNPRRRDHGGASNMYSRQEDKHHQTQGHSRSSQLNLNISTGTANLNNKVASTVNLKGSMNCSKTSLVPPVTSSSSSKRQKVDVINDATGVRCTGLSGGGGVKQVGPASSTGNKNHKLQLTTSRSIGRRYKLLSDVLCTKVAASHS